MLSTGLHMVQPSWLVRTVLPVAICGLTALGCGSSTGRGGPPPPAQTTAPIRSANSGSVATTTSSTPPNAAPTLVMTPLTSTLPLNQAHVITAQADDDGLASGGTLTYSWSQVSGPDMAWLSNPTLAEVRVGLPSEGVYVLRCDVSDGEHTVGEEVRLEGQPIEEVPAFPEIGFLSRTLVGEESAEAYYTTIDPDGTRETLEEFLEVNGFNNGGPDIEATYFNAGDLGFGRDMSAKIVGENQAWITTNHASLDDTIDGIDPIATVVMEISPGPAGGKRFTKFFVYDGDGNRISGIDLDGHGAKYVPDLCISCHGGAPQPIVDGVYGNGGDIGSRLLPFDAATFGFSNRNGFTRADQEAPIKEMNLAVHESPVVSDRTKALIEGWYGGAGFPSATQNDDYVPASWVNEAELYKEVYATSCRTCHAAMDAPLDFPSSDAFLLYSPTIHKELEARTMPDSRRTFEAFWSSPRPALLAASLTSPTPLVVDLDLPQLAVDVERRIEGNSANTLLDVRVDFAALADLAMANPTELLNAADDRMDELAVQRQVFLNEGEGNLARQADQRIDTLDRRRRDMQAWLNQNSMAQLQAQQADVAQDWRDLLAQADLALNQNNRRNQNRVRNEINRLVQDLRGGVRRLERLQRSMHAAAAPIRPAGRR